jgi:hypothetical protein
VRGVVDLGPADASDMVTAAVGASSFRRPLHGVSLPVAAFVRPISHAAKQRRWRWNTSGVAPSCPNCSSYSSWSGLMRSPQIAQGTSAPLPPHCAIGVAPGHHARLKDVPRLRPDALFVGHRTQSSVNRVTTLSGTWSVAGAVTMGPPEGGASRMSSHRQRCLDIRRHSFDT